MPDETNQPIEQPHTGPIDDDYMRNTINQAFDKLPGAQDFLKSLKTEEVKPVVAPAAPVTPDAAAVAPVDDKPSDTKPVVDPAIPPVVAKPQTPEELDKQEMAKQEAWTKYKKGAAEAETLRVEVENLQKQIHEFEGTKTQLVDLQKALDAAKVERESIEGELYKGRVEASRKFKEQVSEPFNTIQKASEIAAKNNDIDPGQLFGAIVRGDRKAVDEMVEGLKVYDQIQVYTMFDDMRRIAAARDGLYANSKQEYDAEIKANQELEHRQTTERNSAVTECVGALAPRLNELFMQLLPDDKREDLGQYAQGIADFDGWPTELRVYNGFAGLILPKLGEAYKSLQVQLKEAQDEISSLRGGAPGIVTGGQPATSANAQADNTVRPGMTTDQLAAESTAAIRKSLGW